MKTPPLTLRANERMLFNRTMIMIRTGKIQVRPGHITITSERMIIEQGSPYFFAFGLLGVLLQQFIKGKRYEIEWSRITSIRRTKYGINDQVLAVTLHDGTVYTLIVKPQLGAITDALHQVGLTVQS